MPLTSQPTQPNMKILAIDTSAEACSVALWCDGAVISRDVFAPNNHTEFALPLLNELREEAQLSLSELDGIAFGAGPGAFTGVRVAASVAHGIALACAVPLVPISSLAALALGGWRHTAITTQLATLDARRGEIYWGLYRIEPSHETVHPIVMDTLQTPDTIVIAITTPWCAVGRGWEVYSESLSSRLHPTRDASEKIMYPNAGDIAALAVAELRAGRGRDPQDALPQYLRAPI
jgi:tRNA threonylcarbamoyladenosine biosynthesis protein TsaB